jgi:ABC-type nitrate/sulfonate/bicarbonate transport system permease component
MSQLDQTMAEGTTAIAPPAVEVVSKGRPKWVYYLQLVWVNCYPLLAILLLWEIFARMPFNNINLFPPASQVLVRAFELAQQGLLFKDASYSLARVLIGGGLAMVFGTVVGLIMGTNRRAEIWLVPPMHFFLSIPGIAILPLAILYIGMNNTTLIVTLGFEAGLTVMLNTWTGVKTVPPNMLHAGRALGARGWTFFWSVLFPASLPSIISGYRQGFSRAWRILAAGEMIVSLSYGLGYRVFTAYDFLDTQTMYASVLVIGILGFLLERVVLRSSEYYSVQRWGMLRNL